MRSALASEEVDWFRDKHDSQLLITARPITPHRHLAVLSLQVHGVQFRWAIALDPHQKERLAGRASTGVLFPHHHLAQAAQAGLAHLDGRAPAASAAAAVQTGGLWSVKWLIRPLFEKLGLFVRRDASNCNGLDRYEHATGRATQQHWVALGAVIVFGVLQLYVLARLVGVNAMVPDTSLTTTVGTPR